MPNLHKLDIYLVHIIKADSQKSVNHITAVFLLAVFKFAWACLVIITHFYPKAQNSASICKYPSLA